MEGVGHDEVLARSYMMTLLKLVAGEHVFRKCYVLFLVPSALVRTYWIHILAPNGDCYEWKQVS